MPASKGRWVLIPLAITVMLCLGTVYSWSIFRKPLEKLLNIGATESLLPFTVLLAVFGVIMPIAGFYIKKFSSQTIIAVGGAVTGLGYILSGFTNSIPVLVLTYGVVAGVGIGITYGVPIAIAAKWFPDRKGIAVGTTVFGFGLSPLITAPLAKNLIAAYGIQQTLLILGVVFTLIILSIAPMMISPPSGWQPAGWTPAVVTNTSTAKDVNLLKSPTFYALWVCYIIGTFAGLAAIGISSPVAQEVVKIDAETAAMTVSLFAIFNGLGRVLFGWVTDIFKPKMTAIAAYVLVIIASILMLSAGTGSVLTYIVAFCLFWLSLGGWLAIAPTATLILFAPENYAINYGIIFTAYSVGALLGTVIAGQIRDIFGSYISFFYITTGLAILGIFISTFMLKREPGLNMTKE